MKRATPAGGVSLTAPSGRGASPHARPCCRISASLSPRAEQHLPRTRYAGSLVCEQEIKPQNCQARAALVRFADDFVIGLCGGRSQLMSGESCFGQIRERFAAYGLTIHPEKDAHRGLPSPLEKRAEAADLRLPWPHPLLGEGPVREELCGESAKTRERSSRGSPAGGRVGVQEKTVIVSYASSTQCCARSCRGTTPTTASGVNSRSLANYWHTGEAKMALLANEAQSAAAQQCPALANASSALCTATPPASSTASDPINCNGPSSLSETFSSRNRMR